MKVLVTGDCRIGNKHTPAGTVLEFENSTKQESELARSLFLAGRIVDATQENKEKIEAEIKASKAREARFERMAAMVSEKSK